MTTNAFRGMLIAALVLAGAGVVAGQRSGPAAVAGLPITEVSIFKDGHAFVRHQGSIPVDAAGDVVMDYLPVPVLGTFWAYSADQRASVRSVRAGVRMEPVEQPATRLRELLAANVGASVFVTEVPDGRENLRYQATVLRVPVGEPVTTRAGGASVLDASFALSDENIILLQTADGVKALPLARIQDVTFKEAPGLTIAAERLRDELTLDLDWPNGKPQPNADIGLVYVQKGLRWIPSYRISIDGKGRAAATLQATVINELADFAGVTANLVVGVPTFAFQHTLDPLSRRTPNTLSSFFQRAGVGLDAAIATQMALPTGDREAVPPQDPALAALGAAQNEDLFLFTLRDFTMARGDRMNLRVSDQTLAYEDVHTLDVPFVPPPDVMRVNINRPSDLAIQMALPKPMHKIRLRNATSEPLTTAPALIVQGNRVVSQGMMPYTAPGGTSDVEIGTSVDIEVVRADVETARTINALRPDANPSFTQIQLTGSIRLTNRRRVPVLVEVTRDILGTPGSASHAGRVDTLDSLASVPSWGYYNWPTWWNQVNGAARITWRVTIDPGAVVTLTNDWSYYWR